MTTETKSHTPWFLWPFVALWKLLAVIVEMTGRFVAMVLGLVFIVVGIIVSLTLIGAIIGIPLAIIAKISGALVVMDEIQVGDVFAVSRGDEDVFVAIQVQIAE